MPPTGTPGLAPPLDRTRDDCLAPVADGHLLVDNLDDLLPAAPPSLDRQHSIRKRTHQLARGMGEARGFDDVAEVPRAELEDRYSGRPALRRPSRKRCRSTSFL